MPDLIADVPVNLMDSKQHIEYYTVVNNDDSYSIKITQKDSTGNELDSRTFDIGSSRIRCIKIIKLLASGSVLPSSANEVLADLIISKLY